MGVPLFLYAQMTTKQIKNMDKKQQKTYESPVITEIVMEENEDILTTSGYTPEDYNPWI